ncbi:MAG: amidase [Proteobacteria bacterium]|nr:amidase [Pseudomonadota bacterium]MCP4919057.1 amidase [Pseudomonadota bacterium]
MRFPEYDQHDACGLADLVHKGEVTPHELFDAAVDRIEARNEPLNAVVTKLYDRARDRLDDLPEGPFKGVPFLVKDLKMMLEGTVTTGSCKLLTQPATYTSVIGKRYQDAGLVILGKTNTPEFGIMGITESELRGPCRNPWNREHTPGGSSGGSASAVAARMVPAAHSGDGGGSIRIPASCCGLFGMKPTRGRVTMAPNLGDAWDGFVQEHVVTRSVRDSAALLDIVDLPTPGEPYAAPHKLRPWRDELDNRPEQLKIAFSRQALFAGENSPECLAALDDSIALLRDLGHEVVEATPTFDRDALVRAYFRVVGSYTAWFVGDAARQTGVKPRAADFEPASWVLAQIGWKMPASDLVEARVTIQRESRKVAELFEDVDCFITPTMAKPPARIGELALSRGERRQLAALRLLDSKSLLDFALDRMGSGKLAWTPNTQLFNQTGQPAMSVPLYWSDKGLPIGTQVVGRFGGEATLFRLAKSLETARPWADRSPAL